MPSSPAYPAAVAQLASQIPAAVVLSPEALAYFTGAVEERYAREVGSRIESVEILDEVLRIGAIAAPPVLAGKVAGYGPLRLRYGFDLAGVLASKVATLDVSRVEAAGAGTAKVTSLHDTRALRTRAIRVLKNLAGRRPEAKKRLSKAAEGKEKADERARSLAVLAKELQDAMANVPAPVAADAGATQALVDDLLEAAGAVLGTRGTAQDARTAVASLYDQMNVLDGRLHHELRQLVGAMNDARKTDKTLPAVKSPLFKSGRKKKVANGGEAPSGGTPVDGGAPAVETGGSAGGNG